MLFALNYDIIAKSEKYTEYGEIYRLTPMNRAVDSDNELSEHFDILLRISQNSIRRDIEVVITALTRNFVVTLEPPTLNPLIYKGFPQFKYNLIA